ncbi:unnamed protein product [Cylindrotheca closterium]|uniref:Uncharacterized protein n=1 Tax=Cylindrotheca closterium TaxID=2856 RepID=A0AAD2G202_9STRA|nr:unnamed protein product [Cylindrotheca closterium]
MATPSGAGAGGSNPPTPFQVQQPTMGKLMLIDSDGKQVAVVGGGAPKDDWSALDPARLEPYCAGQIRTILYDGKHRAYRVKGLETKFNLKGNLRMFQRDVIQHLVANGLDTIAYVPHCQTGIPVHVVEEHPSFTIESVRKQVSAQLLKYDKYDSANDSEAKLFLENSLEPSLLEKLTMRIKTTDSFPVVFITLMYLNRSQSVHRFEAIKESIRKRKPSDYPGEDISLMSEDHKIDAKELVKAGQYHHFLTGSMLDGYLKAGPKDHNLYCHNLLSESQKLERALLDIGYMYRTAADVHVASERLTYEDVSDLAEDNYRKLKDKGEWTPALSTV